MTSLLSIRYFISIILIFVIQLNISLCTHDHLGIAELVHHDQSDSMKNRFSSNFRAKKDLKFPGDLLHVNTDHLSDDQKVILKKIAERVARFGGSEIFSEDTANNQENNSTAAAAATATATATATDPTTIINNNNSTPMVSKSDQSDDDQGDLEIDNEEDDMMARSNLKNSQKIMSAATKQRITNKPDNNDTNGKYIEDEDKKSSSNTTNETIITDPPRIYNNKIDVNHQNNYNINSSSLISNYTEVMLGNISTSSIVDSLSLTNIPKDIYAGRRPPLMPSENDKLKKDPPGTAKPTKYHYYPHNQHIYLLPECAIQQVCNAVYVRLNYTQPLCACPARYRDPCSASINEDDLHTTKLIGDSNKGAITLAKTCETTTEMRECRLPRDWSLLALQNTRTGKSHYLVICRCPDHFILEGPMAHDQPTYASVPGIRVFGMMCVKPGVSVRKPPVISTMKPELNNYYQQKNEYTPLNQTNFHFNYRSDSSRSYSPTTQDILQDIGVTTANTLDDITNNPELSDDDSIMTTIKAIKGTLSNF